MERFHKIGILTFHWADNYGAMLQAYALKAWLAGQGYDPFIINYSPARLRCRDWLVPFRPAKSAGGRVVSAAKEFACNILAGRGWFLQKQNMRRFRETYLVDGHRRCGFRQLSDVDADALVVGSDQIWNPDITFGLMPAYFGAFGNGRIGKTVAYGASLGSYSLPAEYEAGFAKLLDSVGSISTREKGAAEYIRSRFGREAASVIDPVFLPNVRDWLAVESRPARSGYILYHETEPNGEMRRAACRLAEEKGLDVAALAYRLPRPRLPFRPIYSAGPAEFLGYLRMADYVLTNSFHAVAFSLLFHKPFLVYNHSVRGARIEDLLSGLGAAERIAAQNDNPDIDAEIDWEELDQRISAKRRQSEDFLFDALRG